MFRVTEKDKYVEISTNIDDIGRKQINKLSAKIKELISSNKKIILINFKNVEFINGYALGTLAAIGKYVKNRKGKVLIFNINKMLYDIIQALSLEQYCEIHPNKAEALESINDSCGGTDLDEDN